MIDIDEVSDIDEESEMLILKGEKDMLEKRNIIQAIRINEMENILDDLEKNVQCCQII